MASHLATLQQFLDEGLNIKGHWTTASGAKTLKTDKVTRRWYSLNESLTIDGTGAEGKTFPRIESNGDLFK